MSENSTSSIIKSVVSMLIVFVFPCYRMTPLLMVKVSSHSESVILSLPCLSYCQSVSLHLGTN